MVSDNSPPAAGTATATNGPGEPTASRPPTRPALRDSSVAQNTQDISRRIAPAEEGSVVDHVEILTVLVAVVGAGLLLDGIVATFAALFCLGVAVFVLGRVAYVEWRRLELDDGA